MEVLTRLAAALREMPETPVAVEKPARWFRRADGTFSPIYTDGHVGHRFSWTQMLAAAGADSVDVPGLWAATTSPEEHA
ncbi:hypothetical protein [Nocardia sp. CNY236]|uniref:hypothetical protein n=1 Tax=Nocardia sp. CNY236 TaxID=1169152 RepID=UPI0003FAB688|nr:hypothetical protein [Nocardia sp. CNY236]